MFFDRPESGERTVLVQIALDDGKPVLDPREFEELVLSAGGDPWYRLGRPGGGGYG